MVEEIRFTEQALSGSGIKQPVSKKTHELGEDEISDRWARRSLYAAQDIKEGVVLTEEMIITLRPWGGIAPKDAGLVIGKKVLRTIKARVPITWDDFLK
jgi:sialic acid synthase SpsE